MYDYEGDNCNGVEWTRTTDTQYMKEPAYAYSKSYFFTLPLSYYTTEPIYIPHNDPLCGRVIFNALHNTFWEESIANVVSRTRT